MLKHLLNENYLNPFSYPTIYDKLTNKIILYSAVTANFSASSILTILYDYTPIQETVENNENDEIIIIYNLFSLRNFLQLNKFFSYYYNS